MMSHLCPVCWMPDMKPTRKGNIPAHFDRLRIDTCPGGGLPFGTTVMKAPEYQGVTE